MFAAGTADRPQRFGFLLIPNFSMIAFVSAIEPLRLANWVSGRDLYHWETYSTDGAPVCASSGMSINVDSAIGDDVRAPKLFVCGGIDSHLYRDRRVFGWLRRQAAQGSDIGALCTGSHVLARAGLLEGYRCTIHWENLPAFTEEFPDIEVSTELYEIDRSRFTCSGGTAALDMMLQMIALQFGQELAITVSDELIYDRIRDSHDHQRVALRLRLGVSHPKLLQAVTEMEDNLENPLSQGQLAKTVGLSSRQLERLFRKYLSCTPTRYYLELRLDKARHLLLQTSLSVLNVALACGFVSASHFSKCYREHFGRTPREERQPADAARG